MKQLLTNWKTTLAGIIAIVTAIGPVFQAISNGDYAGALNQLPAVIIGIGLIYAKDFNVTNSSQPTNPPQIVAPK